MNDPSRVFVWPGSYARDRGDRVGRAGAQARQPPQNELIYSRSIASVGGRKPAKRAAFYTEPVTIDRTRSKALQERAERYFPGGVNSPVRAFRAVGGAPPFIDRAEGAYLYDADGNRYIDYFGSWGPMILGHAFPPVVEAIARAARNSAELRRFHGRRGRSRRAHRRLLSRDGEDALH